MLPYQLYQSQYVVDHQEEFVKDLMHSAQAMYQYGVFDTSLKYGSYTQYNIFGVSSPSHHTYQLFKEIRDIARKNLPEGRLWIQAWVNNHYETELLGWHNHSSKWHGYVSIRPYDTVTEFDDFTIENKVGQIYSQ